MTRKPLYIRKGNNSQDLTEECRISYDRGRYDDIKKSVYGNTHFDTFSTLSRASSTESLLEDVSARAVSLFHSLDKNQRGYINKEDLFGINSDQSEEELLNVFNQLDRDKDGCINVEDFKTGLKLITRINKNKERRKSRRSSISNWSPPRENEFHYNLQQNKYRKYSSGIMHDESLSQLSCEKICDFYQRIESQDPTLAKMFNDTMEFVMKDYKEVSKEKDLAIQYYEREKGKFEQTIRQMEEEYESQLQQISDEEKRKEIEKIQKEYWSNVLRKEEEINGLKLRLQEVEEESSKLSSAADSSQQCVDLKREVNRLKRENNNYQVQMTTIQTDLALVRSEHVTTRQQMREKIKELQIERDSLKNIEKDYSNLSSQINKLREINRSLQDANDSLRSAVESSPSAAEIMRKVSVSGNWSSPYAERTADNLLLCDPIYVAAAKEKREKYDSSVIDEHGDSGLSTLRDVAELQSEIEPIVNNNVNVYERVVVDDEVFIDQTIQNSTNTIVSSNCSIATSNRINHDSTDDISNASSGARKLARRKHHSRGRKRYAATYNRYGNSPITQIIDSDEDSKDEMRERRANMMTMQTMPVTSMPEIIFKVAFAGDASVGKSTFMMRLCTNSFVSDCQATIGIDFRNKTIELDGKMVGLQLWDTAGQERFRAMTSNYFRKADGVLLLYDSTYPESFIHVREWVDSIRGAAGDDIPIMLIANKCDLRDRHEQEGRRVVCRELGQNLAKEYNMTFSETSAKSGQNINESVVELARNLIKNYDIQASTSRIDIGKAVENEKPLGKAQCCK